MHMTPTLMPGLRVAHLLLLWFLQLSPVTRSLHQPHHFIGQGLGDKAEVEVLAQPSRPWQGDGSILALPQGTHNAAHLGKATGYRVHTMTQKIIPTLLGIFTLLGVIGFLVYFYSVVVGSNSPKLSWWHAETTPLLGTAKTTQPDKNLPARPNTGSSILSSTMGTRSSLGSSQAIDSLTLPSPLIANTQDGEAFVINGTILPKAQDKARIDITRFIDNEVVARVHIAEDSEGSGMLFELVPSEAAGGWLSPQPFGRSVPFVFLDTVAAVAKKAKYDKTRQISVLSASAAGWDATATPSAVVKINDESSFSLLNSGVELLRVFKGVNQKLGHIEGKDRRLVARFDEGASPNQCTVHCAAGSDAGLTLCTVVACMKLMTPQKDSSREDSSRFGSARS